MPPTQPKPAGFGMGQTAPPIVPGRPYDWTIKPGKRNYFERKTRPPFQQIVSNGIKNLTEPTIEKPVF